MIRGLFSFFFLQTLHTKLSRIFHKSWRLEKITKLRHVKKWKRGAVKIYWNQEVTIRHYIVCGSFSIKYAKNPFSINNFNNVDSFDYKN